MSSGCPPQIAIPVTPSHRRAEKKYLHTYVASILSKDSASTTLFCQTSPGITLHEPYVWVVPDRNTSNHFPIFFTHKFSGCMACIWLYQKVPKGSIRYPLGSCATQKPPMFGVIIMLGLSNIRGTYKMHPSDHNRSEVCQ